MTGFTIALAAPALGVVDGWLSGGDPDGGERVAGRAGPGRARLRAGRRAGRAARPDRRVLASRLGAIRAHPSVQDL